MGGGLGEKNILFTPAKYAAMKLDSYNSSCYILSYANSRRNERWETKRSAIFLSNHPLCSHDAMLPKFTHPIMLMTCLVICLRASPTCHSTSNPSQPASSSYPSAFLEKRGHPASSSSSSSSVDSDSTNPPEAPVLKASTFDDGVNKVQTTKRVVSNGQKLRNNAAAREKRKRKGESIVGDPVAMAAMKEKIREHNELNRTRRLALLKANPEAKIVWNLKKKQGADRRRANQLGDPAAMAAMKEKRREYNALARKKMSAFLKTNPAAKIERKLKEKKYKEGGKPSLKV
jgi:hypothetical protein